MAQDLTAPVIDLEAPDAVAQIDHACSNVGFFQCRGHGMPQDVIDDSLEASYEFFRLSSDEKEKAGSGDPEIERGFTAAETEGFAYSMGVETPPDLVQSFSLGRPTYPDDAVFHTTEHHFFDPNIWPERPAGMREALEKWYGAVNRLSDHVLSQVALALDLEEGFFVDKVDHSVDTLRFNYFYVEPDTPEPIAKQFGIGPHTDYGIMTTMYATPGRACRSWARAEVGWTCIPPMAHFSSTSATFSRSGPTTGTGLRCTASTRSCPRLRGWSGSQCRSSEKGTSTTGSSVCLAVGPRTTRRSTHL